MRAVLQILSQELARALAVGLVVGGLLGNLLGSALLLHGAASQVLFTTSGQRFWSVVLATSAGSLLAALALVPVAVLTAPLQAVWPRSAQLFSRRWYAGLLLIGAAAAHSFLWIGFHLVRDLASDAGRLYLAVLATVGVLLVAILTRLARRSQRRPPPPWMRLGVAAVVSASLALVALGRLQSTTQPLPLAERLPQAAVTAVRESTTGTRKNVVIVSIDTLRADHVGSYGYARETTPQLDALAATGTVFTQARSQAPWTLPSHASMMTSLYPSTHGARFFSNLRFAKVGQVTTIPEDNLMLAEMLRASGYRTAAITSVPWLGNGFGFAQGFDHLEMSLTNHPAATIVDKGLDWFEAESDKPSFLFLHFFDVHHYSSPPQYDSMFRDGSYQGMLVKNIHRIIGNLYDSLSSEDLTYAVAKYDGAIRYIDNELGRFFDRLRKSGRLDDTLVIVTSDHGEEFWDHGGTGHGFTLYDEQLHVPFIVKPPSGFEVRVGRSDDLVAVMDVVPTVLDYLQLQQPTHLEGLSVRGLIEGQTPAEPRELFAEDTYYFNSYCVIRDKHKYIGNRFPPNEMSNPTLLLANVRAFYKFKTDELYALQSDDHETDNRIEELPRRANDMRLQLQDHVRKARTGQATMLDRDTVGQLRSLGYLQ